MGRARLLIRTLLLLCTLAMAAFPQAPKQQQGQLDGSETLFTVLAAMNAAGYDADLESGANSPVRKQVRQIVTERNPASLADLKRFFDKHRQNSSEAELSQYISFALTLDGPPDFQYHMTPEEMPLDARALEGFPEILARFYQEANIADLWKRARPAYDQVIAAYHTGVSKALLESNAYLRNPTSGYRGRRFQIYLDLLGAPNQIQSRSYKDDYFVVVTPSPEPQIEEVRHSYLHYLLDPLSLRYFEQLNRLKGLADFANPAPALPQAYKDDFILLATECLIKAVETRLSPAAKRAEMVDHEMREGYVLTAALADQLAVYEKQPEAIRRYFPDLVGLIDLQHEDNRLDKLHFAKAAAIKKAKPAPAAPEPVITGTAKTLEEAESLYKKRDLDGARTSYRKVLEQPGESGLHAKAYYGLARVAALQRDPELAEKLFEKTLELSPDPETKAWSYVYLARLADAAGEREQAAKHYRAAIAVDGASDAVKTAAEKGLAQPFQKAK
jgi:tetratricopeptide (TPR) repeat protein